MQRSHALVLDIDGTLIDDCPTPLRFDLWRDVDWDYLMPGGNAIKKRPGVDAFLDAAFASGSVALWTHAGQRWASIIVNDVLVNADGNPRPWAFVWDGRRATPVWRRGPKKRDSYSWGEGDSDGLATATAIRATSSGWARSGRINGCVDRASRRRGRSSSMTRPRTARTTTATRSTHPHTTRQTMPAQAWPTTSCRGSPASFRTWRALRHSTCARQTNDRGISRPTRRRGRAAATRASAGWTVAMIDMPPVFQQDHGRSPVITAV